MVRAQRGRCALDCAPVATGHVHFEDTDAEETVMPADHRVPPGQLQATRFYSRERLPSSEVLKWGRNASICHYFSGQTRVPLSVLLQPFKTLGSSVVSSEIEDGSRKADVMADSKGLGRLNETDLLLKHVAGFASTSVSRTWGTGRRWRVWGLSFFCLQGHSCLTAGHRGGPNLRRTVTHSAPLRHVPCGSGRNGWQTQRPRGRPPPVPS